MFIAKHIEQQIYLQNLRKEKLSRDPDRISIEAL